MVSKGRCFEGSYLAELKDSDFLMIQKMMEEGSLGFLLKEDKHSNTKIKYQIRQQT